MVSPLKTYTAKVDAKICFSLPEKVIVGSGLPVHFSADVCFPVENMLVIKTDASITAWKSLALLFVRKNQDNKLVLRYNFNIMGSVEHSIDPSQSVLEGRVEFDMLKAAPSFFEEEIEYCCYLVSYDKIAGPVMLRLRQQLKNATPLSETVFN